VSTPDHNEIETDLRVKWNKGGFSRMQGPLESLEQWDDFVKERYDPNRTRDEFRKYTDETPPVVREFYRLNHTYQTR